MDHVWLYPGIKERFEQSFGRPFPWYEVVDEQTLDAHVNAMSRRVPGGPYPSLRKVIAAAMDHVQWKDLVPSGEPPSLVRAAMGRFGIDSGESMLLVTDHTPVYRFRSKDLVTFGQAVFPEPPSFAQSLLAENGDWIVIFHHEGRVGAMKLR